MEDGEDELEAVEDVFDLDVSFSALGDSKGISFIKSIMSESEKPPS